jgi:hypothetical protein
VSAVEPSPGQDPLISGTVSQGEEGIFDQRTVGVLGFDCRGQPTRPGRQRAGQLCYCHAAVYRSHFDRSPILDQRHAGLAARYRIELGAPLQRACRQAAAEPANVGLVPDAHVKRMRGAARSGQADVQAQRQTSPALPALCEKDPSLGDRL